VEQQFKSQSSSFKAIHRARGAAGSDRGRRGGAESDRDRRGAAGSDGRDRRGAAGSGEGTGCVTCYRAILEQFSSRPKTHPGSQRPFASPKQQAFPLFPARRTGMPTKSRPATAWRGAAVIVTTAVISTVVVAAAIVITTTIIATVIVAAAAAAAAVSSSTGRLATTRAQLDAHTLAENLSTIKVTDGVTLHQKARKPRQCAAFSAPPPVNTTSERGG
jgi:hypothetical protein